MSSLPLAVVVGSTGTQGVSVCKALSKDGYQVRALTRKPDAESTKAKLGGIANVEPFYFDVEEPESIEKAFEGAKIIYALSNPDLVAVLEPPGSDVKSLKLNEFEQGKAMVDVALKLKDLEIFVWSTTPSAIEQSKGKYTTLTLFNEKCQVEDYIKEKGLPSFFPQLGAFSDNHINYHRCKLAPNGQDILYEFASPPALDDVRLPQVSIAHDLGTVISTLIKHYHTDNLKYQHFRVAERYYSLQEMLDTIARVTGRKVEFVPLPVWGAKDSVYDHNADPDVAFYPEGTFPDEKLAAYGIKFQTWEGYVREYLAPGLGITPVA
ncbi:NAD(P)-binding protein [Pseudohyphozyma bogoriensis]|nr:NAD(P)-binding protein [Pseudohyphozyma bogoriensis]